MCWQDEQKRIFNEMAIKINWITGMFFGNAQASLKSSSEARKATYVNAINAAYRFADELNTAFPNGEFIDAEITVTKQAVEMHGILMDEFPSTDKERGIYISKARYIKKYDASYEVPSIPGVTSQQIESGLTVEEIEKEIEANAQKEKQEKEANAQKEKQEKEAILKKIERGDKVGCIVGIIIAVLGFLLGPKLFIWLLGLIFA